MRDLPPVGRPLYVDHAATTAVYPEVVEAMLPYMGDRFGNPSSSMHARGREAADALQNAREQVAALVGGFPSELVFTSGATESINLALLGLREYFPRHRNAVATTRVEHKSVLEVVGELRRGYGTSVEYMALTNEGAVDQEQLDHLAGADLMSVQLANSVTGVSNDLSGLSDYALRSNTFIHVDATQGIGVMDFNIADIPLDLVSFGAHKIGGPMGIGALFVNSNTVLEHMRPIMYGGSQESGLRPGTENVPAAVGFGVACEIVGQNRHDYARHLKKLTAEFEGYLHRNAPSIKVVGCSASRIGGITCLHFSDVEAGAILARLGDVQASFGAACESGSLLPSSTLLALGMTEADAFRSIRFSFGRTTSLNEAINLAQRIETIYNVIGQFN